MMGVSRFRDEPLYQIYHCGMVARDVWKHNMDEAGKVQRGWKGVEGNEGMWGDKVGWAYNKPLYQIYHNGRDGCVMILHDFRSGYRGDGKG